MRLPNPISGKKTTGVVCSEDEIVATVVAATPFGARKSSVVRIPLDPVGGLATGLAAVIPFGISLVWIPAAVGLAAQGSWGAALFVTLWSSLIVGLVDNLLRPLFISGPSKIPFILVFFGLIGGLAAYGPLGLVLGPVLLGVLLALWRTTRESVAEGG